MDLDARPTLETLVAGADATEKVELVVPPSSDFLRTIRLVAADTAVRAGCDLDEVEDFRIAVDELSHLLMTSTDHLMHLSLACVDGHVVGRGVAHDRGGSVPIALDEVSAMIVEATTDGHRVERRDGSISFEVAKRVASRP
jgi:hypothetical protein